MQIGAGVVAASGAVALGIDGVLVQFELRFADIDALVFGFAIVEQAGAGQAGRGHAIAHIGSGFEYIYEVGGASANTHGVEGQVFGKQVADCGDCF